MSSLSEAMGNSRTMPAGMLNRTWAALRRPLLAPFLLDRKVAAILSGVALTQLSLLLAGLEGWPCPIRAVLGIPCPGCGLSRAMILLLHGEFKEAGQLHPFAPLFMAGIFLVFLAALLPFQRAQQLANAIAAIEKRTGITAFLLLGLMCWWAARLLLV